MKVCSVLTQIAHGILSIHGSVAYVLIGLLVFSEDAVMLGFVLPGETAATVGGALAALGHLQLVLVLIVVAAAAVAGDSTGYELGKVAGPYLLEHRPLKDRPAVGKARQLLLHYGGAAVFLGRWVAVGRAFMPGLAGMAGMRYRTFLTYNVAGGIPWSATYVLIGYALGTSFEKAASVSAWASGGIVTIIVLAAVAWHYYRKHSPGAVPGEADDGSE
ncbi:MAG: DedA family protein [Acidimicrobiales bacterium]